MPLRKLDTHAFHWLVDLLESVEIGLVVLDLDFRIQLWNGFMENHSSLTASAVRDKNLLNLFPDLPVGWLRHKVNTAVTLKARTFTCWEQRPYLFRFGVARPITGITPTMYQNLTITPLAEPDGSIKRICLMIYDVTEEACSRLALEQANAQLAQLSITDNLTGLLNRGAWENQLNAEFARYQRYGNACSLVILDIDNFKSINDQYGHPTGDEVIRHVATIIRTSLRNTDYSGRYGGEEFAIVLPETHTEGAIIIVERLRRTIEAAVVMTENIEIRYTVSSGIATLEAGINHATEWLRQADNALYAAKRAGKNRTEVA